MIDDCCDIKKEGPTGIFKTLAFTGNRKCLTREASTKHIEIRDLIQFNIVYIGIKKLVISVFVFFKKRWFDSLVVFFISYTSVLIPFTCKNAFSTNGMHCRVEPTDTSKQINELEFRFTIVLDNFFTRHLSLRVESERVHSRGSDAPGLSFRCRLAG